MATRETLQIIREILTTACDIGPETDIGLDTRFIEDLALDSMGLLTLTVELENHYRQVLAIDTFAPPTKVGDLVLLIEKFQVEKQHEDIG